MSEPATTPPSSPSDEANRHFEQGLALKTQGQSEAALTEFRRAAIADPAHLAAHLEIGFLCKEKARRDPVFNNHVFASFRAAARLDLNHEVAHDQYILAAQKSGSLDEIRTEYEALSKRFPDNELIKRCYKNIVALSLAMMPQRVTVADGKGGLRKLILLGSMGVILLGISVIIGGVVAGRRAKIKGEQAAPLIKIGLAVASIGLGGLLVRSRVR